MEEKAPQNLIPPEDEQNCQSQAQTNEQPTEKAAQPQQTNADELFPPLEQARSKKSRILSNIFFAIVIVTSFFFMYQLSAKFTGQKDVSFAEMIAGANLKYVLLLVGIFLLILTIDALKYYVIMRATCPEKAKFRNAVMVSLVGKYYDYITPFSSGGQPFQIVYLNGKGYRGGESSAIIFVKFAFNMSMWLTICCLLMTLNNGALSAYVTDAAQLQWFIVAGWIGFGLNCLFPLFIVMFAIFPKMTETITRWMLNIGYKLRLVKDKEHIIDRARQIADDFKRGFFLVLKKPLYFFLTALTCFAEPFLSMALPYFAVIAFGGSGVTPGYELMFAIMTLNVYTQMSVMFVPTPGNSLAMEGLFMAPLKTIVSEGVLFWTVLCWRFFSYYAYIVIGIVITVVQVILRNKRKTAK